MAMYSAKEGVILVNGKLLRYADNPTQADTALEDMFATVIIEEELNRMSARGRDDVGVVVMYLGSAEEVLSKVGRGLGRGPFTQGGDLRPRFMFCWHVVRRAQLKARAIWRSATYGAPAGIYLTASRYKGQLPKGQR